MFVLGARRFDNEIHFSIRVNALDNRGYHWYLHLYRFNPVGISGNRRT